MPESSLVENAKRIVAERNRERGQGRTREFMHNHGFPTYVSLEEVAGGLLGDVSGRLDIMERVSMTSEDASLEMLFIKLETVLRARLFTLLAEVLPEFLRQARENRATEWELNVLLRLMAEAQPVAIYHEHEAIELAVSVNRANATDWTAEAVLGKAIQVLQKTCRHDYQNGRPSTLQGLVPVRVDRGIGFTFVPVRQID